MHHQLDGGPVGPAQVSHGRNKMPWRTAEPAPWRFESGLRVTAEQPHGYEDWLSTRRTHAREYKSGVWAAKNELLLFRYGFYVLLLRAVIFYHNASTRDNPDCIHERPLLSSS